MSSLLFSIISFLLVLAQDLTYYPIDTYSRKMVQSFLNGVIGVTKAQPVEGKKLNSVVHI
jgi:hypothetical protein